MTYIFNFNISRELSDINEQFVSDRKTNIDFLLEGFTDGEVEWSIPSNAVPGDIALFMCAKSAKNNISMALSHMPQNRDSDFKSFLIQQKELYRTYSGFILGFGTISSILDYDEQENRQYN